MAFGKMRCIGDSLHLKNKFGAGYSLTVFCDIDNTEKLIYQLQNLEPSLVLKENDAGMPSFSS